MSADSKTKRTFLTFPFSTEYLDVDSACATSPHTDAISYLVVGTHRTCTL